MAKTRTEPTPPASRLVEHLKELKRPAFRDHDREQAERAAQEEWGYPPIPGNSAAREVETRTQGRGSLWPSPPPA